jgi:predicted DNA-binding transcriptional regulator AlpA
MKSTLMLISCDIESCGTSARPSKFSTVLFLRAFGARVDNSLFTLKHGCNLRFFLKSIRYSEDMDLDIHTMSVSTPRNNVDRVIEAPSFTQTLRAQNIEIARTSSPKQTETTQRWKLILRLPATLKLATRAVRWVESEIRAWIAARIMIRDGLNQRAPPQHLTTSRTADKQIAPGPSRFAL